MDTADLAETSTQPLWSGFHNSALTFPNRPALEVNGQVFSYARLRERAASLAATLFEHASSGGPPLTAVFAYRSATAFAGVLASLLRGHGYVPLNRTFPPQRSRQMLERSQCRSLIVDAGSESQLEEVLANIGERLLLILPDREEVKDLASRWPRHLVLGAGDLEPAETWVPPKSPPEAIAYLLFTSGSTGIPKGVMVSHRNVRHYLDWTVNRYQISEEDRLSQTFDMTFDLSVHDMFVAWERGACVCCPTQKQSINPGGFIKESRLTTWFSVPSTAVFMRRFGMLKPGLYPQLRLSLFCGEALPVETVTHWAEAAPNAIIENIYGPTELTIACTAYRWDRVCSPAQCELGLVPIGEPFAGLNALVLDESLAETPPGAVGELLVSGPQVSLGYWMDPERTGKAFVLPPGKTEVYYRTGDNVRRPELNQPLKYIGRVDNQVKVLGHRVEPGEIEAVLREESGIDAVVAVAVGKGDSGSATGIEAFVQAASLDAKEILERVGRRLPAYMVPKRIHLVPTFPLNPNGKFDRQALIKSLEPTL